MSTPRRFELGEKYLSSSLGVAGTIVVRKCEPYGFTTWFTTTSPCCKAEHRIDARMSAGYGKLITCGGCGWKWDVYLCDAKGQRLSVSDGELLHPHIPRGRAEWVSRGFGKRKYIRRKP